MMWYIALALVGTGAGILLQPFNTFISVPNDGVRTERIEGTIIEHNNAVREMVIHTDALRGMRNTQIRLRYDSGTEWFEQQLATQENLVEGMYTLEHQRPPLSLLPETKIVVFTYPKNNALHISSAVVKTHIGQTL